MSTKINDGAQQSSRPRAASVPSERYLFLNSILSPSKTHTWQVSLSTKALHGARLLDNDILKVLIGLIQSIQEKGPVQHYHPLSKCKNIPADSHHEHLSSGKIKQVACWASGLDKKGHKSHEVMMFYVGTHEHAPYQKY